MRADTIGISAVNGADFFTQRERFELFSKVGFGSVMLAWGGDDDRRESLLLAEEYGLKIENAHSNMRGCNPLWLSGAEGDAKETVLRKTVEDCGRYGVKTMVMHLSNGFDVPSLSEVGLNRIDRILNTARDCHVTVALENVRVAEHLRYVLDNRTEDHVKFCFDAGHANIWCRDVDWLSLYGKRLAALHLHDNGGEEDDHLIPMTGTVNWDRVLRAVDNTSYMGALTIETEVRGIRDKSELSGYLQKVYSAGKELSRKYGRIVSAV